MPAGNRVLTVATNSLIAPMCVPEPQTPYRPALEHPWYGRTLMLLVGKQECVGTVVGFSPDFSACLMQLSPEAVVDGLLVLAVTVPFSMVQAEYEGQKPRR